jgi:CRP-like cAMP-binding protein
MLMSPAKHFLTNIFTSEDFPGEEQHRIISSFRKVAFRKNEYLIKESEIENNYWFIESGFARSYVVDTSGNDITTDFFTKSNVVIDWSSFFLRTPTQENIQALTDCSCWQLDFDSFQELFHSIQTFREHGRSRLVTGYQAIKEQRISMVADKAKDRYIRLLQEKPCIVQSVSLKHIATFLGITDTSLSRIRKEISSD